MVILVGPVWSAFGRGRVAEKGYMNEKHDLVMVEKI